MKKRFISFGSTPFYYNAAKRLTEQALSIDQFDSAEVFTKSHLDDWFVSSNTNILSQPRGDGYWLWKPFVIFKEMLALDDGDLLVYCDSLFDLNKDSDISLSTYIYNALTISNQDVFCVHNKPNDKTYLETSYTKGDAFVIIPGSNQLGNQVWAGLIGIRKSLKSISFIAEWLTYSQDERIITDKPDEISKPFPNFIDNRHDQSVLSLVARKWNITFVDCPPMLIDLRRQNAKQNTPKNIL